MIHFIENLSVIKSTQALGCQTDPEHLNGKQSNFFNQFIMREERPPGSNCFIAVFSSNPTKVTTNKPYQE